MRFIPFYIVIMLFLASCGSAKTEATTSIKAMPLKEIVKLHDKSEANFKTLAGRMQLAYESQGSGQRISVNFRIKKDEVIWAKASILGITIAKVYITPKSVQYYETIGRTYFDGDFSLLSDWLGTPVDFEKTQNILLGQSIFKISNGRYTTVIDKNNYKIEPKKQPENFIHELLLNPSNYKVIATAVSQPQWNRDLDIHYDTYQKIGDNFFPSKISIHTIEDYEMTKIEINYRKIDLNPEINFPFELPERYTPVKL